jgi:ribosomal protein L37E
MACPDCGGPVWPERERLCPNCGYPLMFLRPDKPESESYGIARSPGERADATAILTPPGAGRAAPPPQPQVWTGTAQPHAGELTCPRCGHRSPLTRTRCEQCGMELRATHVLPHMTPPLKAPSARRKRTGLVVALVLLAIAVLVLGTYLLVHRPNNAPPPSPASAAPVARLVRIDSGTVRVRASSTNPNEPRYRVASIQDGSRATAWNSHGENQDSNVGVTVTFTFDRPVKLARITMINGYVRRKDLFQGNERVAKLTVQADAAEAAWDVRDSDQPQSLDLDPKPTNKVTLVIDAVYPGNRYRDVCITEVVFYERP